jgi:two-component system cell cycle response regulator
MNNEKLNPSTVEIASGVYWIGASGDDDDDLNCNPYVILDGEEAVLIDPGSPLDFKQVLTNLISLTPLDKISAIILHHQDPDLCASVSLFEKHGLSCPVILHWRTSTITALKIPFISSMKKNGFIS